MKWKEKVILTEFDLKLTKYLDRNGDPLEQLQDLELMRQMEGKSDEEFIEILMVENDREHQEFMRVFGN